jgi:elongation factor Ts
MPEITATAVKALRDKTNLPMMDCKKALEAAGGDPEAAVQWLREQGKKTYEKRAGRETAFGRIAIHFGAEPPRAAMIELRCESAPVMNAEGFVQLANDLARRLAEGPGASGPDELLAQASPSKGGETLKEQMDHLFNQVREVFRLARIVRIDGPSAGYVHHNGALGVLLAVDGRVDPVLAKDICMHIAAMRPKVISPSDLDPAKVQQEREILREAARKEGKPEKILDKMVEGRLRDFYAQQCLTEQPFVKDSTKSVGQVAKAAGMKLARFVCWEVGKES